MPNLSVIVTKMFRVSPAVIEKAMASFVCLSVYDAGHMKVMLDDPRHADIAVDDASHGDIAFHYAADVDGGDERA